VVPLDLAASRLPGDDGILADVESAVRFVEAALGPPR
jgi:hypothetical protein